MAIHSIWVLEYAWTPAAPAGAIVFGDYDKPPRKLPYACILPRGPGVVAMVDVGYNAAAYGGEMADRFGVRGWRPPSAVLAEADLRPETWVTSSSHTRTSIMQATPTPSPMRVFYLQKRELSKWVWAR
jgi:N-acyl homoserine lactone hydrolase